MRTDLGIPSQPFLDAPTRRSTAPLECEGALAAPRCACRSGTSLHHKHVASDSGPGELCMLRHKAPVWGPTGSTARFPLQATNIKNFGEGKGFLPYLDGLGRAKKGAIGGILRECARITGVTAVYLYSASAATHSTPHTPYWLLGAFQIRIRLYFGVYKVARFNCSFLSPAAAFARFKPPFPRSLCI